MNSEIIKNYLLNKMGMKKSEETDSIDEAILQIVKERGKKMLKDEKKQLSREQSIDRMIKNCEFMIKNLKAK